MVHVFVLLAMLLANGQAEKMASAVTSPDGKVIARVYSAVDAHRGESRVEIRLKQGPFLKKHDFFSPDGQHGFGIEQAQWTLDSRFLVLSMTNAEGHSPTHAPLVIWRRADRNFYQLPSYTADGLKLTDADGLQVRTWPDLKPVTISLRRLPRKDMSLMR